MKKVFLLLFVIILVGCMGQEKIERAPIKYYSYEVEKGTVLLF